LTITPGLELCTCGTFTLKVVSPWIIEGKLAGYFELGKEVSNIIDDISLYYSIEKRFLNH